MAGYGQLRNYCSVGLEFFHGLVGNWGWAIILLTVLVKRDPVAIVVEELSLNGENACDCARNATHERRVR